MTIGQRIKAARKNAGLTQKELGQRLGVAYQTLAQWENDLRKPKYETIQRIIDALDISFSELMGMKQIDDNTWVAYGEEHIEEIDNFLRYYDGRARADAAMDQMCEEGKDRVAEYAEAILPRYRLQEPTEDPLDSTDGKDTPAAQDAPEGAGNGE